MDDDAAGRQVLSHFVSGLDLSVKDDVRGPFQVGKLGAGFVSGYFALVPAAWQEALGGPVLNGNCCLSRTTVCHTGTAAFAIDPAKIGTTYRLRRCRLFTIQDLDLSVPGAVTASCSMVPPM